MRIIEIVTMLTFFPQLCIGRQSQRSVRAPSHSVYRHGPSCIPSRRKHHHLRRNTMSPSPFSTMRSCCRVSKPALQASAFTMIEHSKFLSPLTRRLAISSSPLLAFAGYDDEYEEEGSSQQNGVFDNRPKSKLSPRAAYQFYPIQPGSSRPMPPSGSYSYANKKDNNIADEETSDDDYPLEMYDNLVDSVEIVPAKKTFRIIQQEKRGEPIPSSNASKDLPSSSDDQAITQEKRSDSSVSALKRFMPRVTPSFMEPIKTRAMTVSMSNDALNSDDSQRKLPTEASNGSSSTSHLETLYRQLEHLALQIYRLNNGEKFNINSPKQVARVLFGDDDTGDTRTNKDVLEALASAGNEMA